MRAITDIDTRDSSRLSAIPIVPPASTITTVDKDVWNPDGSQTFSDLNTLPGFTALFATVVAQTDIDHATGFWNSLVITKYLLKSRAYFLKKNGQRVPKINTSTTVPPRR